MNLRQFWKGCKEELKRDPITFFCLILGTIIFCVGYLK